jgi:caffeoyl-CoA O-methyltransferase
MTMLAGLMGARHAIEVGTFTGYSSICVARGLAPGGRLICCDISEEWTSVARAYWQKAGLADRIELRLGPALGTLRALPGEPSFDLAFIDADKEGYIAYWGELVPRVRGGGVILVDNTFLHGRILDPKPGDRAQAVRDFNDHALADGRVDLVMLSVGDGLTMARKR